MGLGYLAPVYHNPKLSQWGKGSYNEPEANAMEKNEIEKIIFQKAVKFLSSVPKDLGGTFLLTGGAAAFLYGSDRPFSNDIDFMVPKKKVPAIEKKLGVAFALRAHKPVFHSLACSVTIGGTSFDLVAQSIVEPKPGSAFVFQMNDELLRRSRPFKRGKSEIHCVPPEYLILVKLLAGRGKELGKFDLYDVAMVVEKTKGLDWRFLDKLAKDVCSPMKKALPILEEHVLRIRKDGHSKAASLLEGWLSSIR
jgi:hypothetical protein